MTTKSATDWSAWTDPWVPVVDGDDRELLVSLRDLFVQSHSLKGLGSGLTPLDIDSLLRFLPAVGAVIARQLDDEEELGESFPADAVDAFGMQFGDRFALCGERPFLQRWDLPASRLDDLVADAGGKEVRGLNPIEQLLPSVPGASSSQWAVRVDNRDPADPAVVTLLLVTAWFQTKNGNGQDPFGGKHLKGSASTWHTNPLAVYYVDPMNLGRTLYSNMPAAWLDRSDLPLFLDRTLPADFASAPMASLTRFTYSKTLPLLYSVDDRLIGFVLGADDTIEIPVLGKDFKESLGKIHEGDHTRLYFEASAKNGRPLTLQPRGSFEARLSTTEGFSQWFREDRGIGGAMERWRDIDRVRAADLDELPRWHIGLFGERTDGKGSRTSVAWDLMPARFAAAEGRIRPSIAKLLGFANECRWSFVAAGRTATGDAKVPAAIVAGQAAFYTALQSVLDRLKYEVATTGVIAEVHGYFDEVGRQARETFRATTDPLITPRQIAAVAQARAEYDRRVRIAQAKHEPKDADTPKTSDSKEKG